METIARESSTKYISKHHGHVLVKETGLHFNPNYPYLVASLDGIVCCSCHGEILLEIKSPLMCRENLKGWELDKYFLISGSGEIKKLHRYFYQMQHKTKKPTKKQHFFIFGQNTQNRKTFFLLEVPRDKGLISTFLKKYGQLFFDVI